MSYSENMQEANIQTLCGVVPRKQHLVWILGEHTIYYVRLETMTIG